ncbi:MAG: xanthine dehydrogenase family protein molybdopterin-binding subunit [Candidatus Jordarchaeaceae archaeon]
MAGPIDFSTKTPNQVITKDVKERIRYWKERYQAGYRVIGNRVPRIDARAKVMGKARYVDDITFPNMLWGKILRAPYAHAKIKNIDVTRALRLPGVKAIFTYKDVPRVYMVGIDVRDEPLLAWDGVVRYVGQEVAAVAATDPDIAEEAIHLIKVDYEVLPAVLTVEEALSPEAPLVHHTILELKADPDIYGPSSVKNNIAWEISYERGDVEKGLKEADVVVEDEFVYKNVVAAYMEPDGCVGYYDVGSGKLTLWVSSQWPSNIRDVISRNLGLPLHKVRVVQEAVGGAFGSKFTANQLHHIVALLTIRTERPVKIVLTREEDFQIVRSRGNMKIWMKFGAKKDGTMTAEQTKILVDNGAYQYLLRRRSLHMLERNDALYRFKNVKHEVKNVYTNKAPAGTYRSFGDVQMTWARESLMDILADELKMDPAELRLKNATRTGDITVNGWFIRSCGLMDCLKEATKISNWKEKRTVRIERKGIGIACTCHETDDKASDGFYGTVAYVKFFENGTVQLLIGEAEYGQGAHNAFAMVIAEELGVPLESIEVVHQDTDRVPWGWGALGSRIMSQGVNATYLACQDAKRQIIEIASELIGKVPENLRFENGKVYLSEAPEVSVSLAEITKYAMRRTGGSMIIGKGVEERFETEYILKVTHPTHYGRGVDATYFDTVVAEVEVDLETGEIKVLNIVVTDDCGKVIDRMQLEGQVDGATLQGLGAALNEEIIVDRKGKILNPNFHDYKVPLAPNVPPIKKIFIESIEPGYAYGCKGGGESAGVGSLIPAIANAVYHATGIRIKTLPLLPSQILEQFSPKIRVRLKDG